MQYSTMMQLIHSSEPHLGSDILATLSCQAYAARPAGPMVTLAPSCVSVCLSVRLSQPTAHMKLRHCHCHLNIDSNSIYQSLH